MDRLKIDFPTLFRLCEVTTMDCSQEAMEEGLKENIFVDYRRRGNKFECTTVEAISNTCKTVSTINILNKSTNKSIFCLSLGSSSLHSGRVDLSRGAIAATANLSDCAAVAFQVR